MLQRLIQLSGTWFFKIILVIIALSFVGYEVTNYLGGGGPQTVATVNGSSINSIQVNRQVDQKMRQARETLGNDAANNIDRSEMVNYIVDDNIRTTLLRQKAYEIGLRAPDDILRQIIRNSDGFKDSTGVFSRRFYESVLAQNNMTPTQYEKYLAQDLMVNQMRAPFGTLQFVHDSAVERLAEYNSQTIDLKRLIVTTSDVEAPGEPSEADIQVMYEDAKHTMKTPELRYISVLEFSPSLVEVEPVTVSEAKEYFEQNIALYQGKEHRRVRHILTKTEDDAKAAYQALTEKEQSFADVAKEYSQDKSTSHKGGIIGFIEQGEMPDVYDSLAFSLEKSEISEPLKTPFGWYIIEVMDIDKPEPIAFEDMKKQIMTTLKAEKKEDALYTLINEADELIAGGASLEEVAAEVGGKFKDIGLIDPLGMAPDGNVTDFSAQEELMETAFSLEDGAISLPIAVNDNLHAFIQVKEVRPPQALPLEDVRGNLVELLKAEEQRKQMVSLATKILAQRSQGKSLEDLAKEYSLQAPTAFNDIARDSKKVGLNPETLAELFKIEANSVLPKTVNTTHGLAIFEVTDRHANEPTPAMVNRAKQELGASLRMTTFTQLVNHLYNNAEIVIYDEQVERLSNAGQF